VKAQDVRWELWITIKVSMEWFLGHARLLLLIIPFFASDVAAQQTTNYQLLVALTDSLLHNFVVENIAELEGDIVIRSLDSDGQENWFFEDRVIQQLQHTGKTVYVERQNASPLVKVNGNWTWSLEYKILHLGIRYEDVGDTGDTALVGRIGRAGFTLRVIAERSGKVEWSGELKGEKKDHVTNKNRVELEDETIHFTVGKGIAPQRRLGLFKPLLISGAAGVIVFLFFSLRSR